MHALRIPVAIDDVGQEVVARARLQRYMQRHPLADRQRKGTPYASSARGEIGEFHGLAVLARHRHDGRISHDDARPAPRHSDFLAAHKQFAESVKKLHEREEKGFGDTRASTYARDMSIELVNTIAACATFLVILASALAAIIQLRHLRAGNDLQGLLKVLEMAYEPAIQDAFDFLTHDFPTKIQDPDFRRELLIHPIDSHVHKELIAMEYYERLGSYVKNNMISAKYYLDCSSPELYWDALAPVIWALRKNHGDSAYENFEYLVVLSQDWNARHPNGNYPKGVRRLVLPPFEV